MELYISAMERLSELANFVSKYKASKIEIVGDSNDTLLNRLYNGINDNHFTSDDIAAKSLGYEDPKSPSYKKLKYLLERRLINTVFFIDLNTPQFNSSQRAYANCYKNFAAFRILLARGAEKSAYHLAEKTLRKALENEITLIVFDLSRSLKIYFESRGNNPKKAKLYKAHQEKSGRLYRVEILAQDYFNDILGKISGKRGALNDKELIEKSRKYQEEIIKESKGFFSKNLYYYSNQLRILQYELALDYKNVIKVCNEAIEFLEPLDYKRGIIRFGIQLMIAYVSLNRFKEAFEQAERVFATNDKGVGFWFVGKELYFLLCFRSKNYELAFDTFIETLSHKNFKIQQPRVKEPWKVYEAYIHFFIEAGKIKPKKSKQLKKFKLGKFLNEVPLYSKDKSGLNIQILIVQVLFLFRKGKIDEAIDRIASLNQYCHKYLRKDHTLRSNCFIKMLVVLITNQFHKEATLRKTQRYMRVLKENPIQKAKQSIGVEIVPFEDLWEIIIPNLKNEFMYTPARKKRVDELFPRRK